MQEATTDHIIHPLSEDEHYMSRCLHLAQCGRLGAAPNPMVGAVIVYNGHIIGEGYHIRCGGPHAEVNAIASVKHPELLTQSTMYVSLEPCAHFGRTPPCAHLIIEKRIPRVVVGMVDPFAKVHGRGIQMLREAGIQVTTGVLESACRHLNQKFITNQLCHRPFVTLKWAQSNDGYIAPKSPTGSPIFFSTPHSLIAVHQQRALHQAILVGRNTAEVDNPSLTLRLWSGNPPLRIALDSEARLSANLRLFNDEAPTLIVGQTDLKTRHAHANYDFFQTDPSHPILPQLLTELNRRNIQSLLVEGGTTLLNSFIKQNLWDEARIEIANKSLGEGILAPTLSDATLQSTDYCFGSRILHHTNPNPSSC